MCTNNTINKLKEKYTISKDDFYKTFEKNAIDESIYKEKSMFIPTMVTHY